MSALSIGLSALQVNQRLLTLTGQNIANANTPNYQRQIAALAAREAGGLVGAGVEILDITRVTNLTLQDAILRNNVSAQDASAQLEGLRQLQAYLAPGEGSLRDSLDSFFSEAVKLTTNPADLTQRRIVLNAAGTVADRLNTTVNDLSQQRVGLVSQAKAAIATVNDLASQIAELNQRIQEATTGKRSTSDLINNRDQAIAKLSELIDVRVTPTELNRVNINAAGLLLVANATVTPLQASVDTRNQLVVFTDNASNPANVQGGKLAGLLTLHNSTIVSIKDRLGAFSQALIAQLDGIQATGLGLDGPLTAQTSTHPVLNVNQPLASARLAAPPTAGELAITVTDLATGARVLRRLPLDPQTQSLTDVAAAISTVPHLHGVVDPQSGSLRILAAPGYGFDFTGNSSSVPDTAAITGSTTAAFGGQYSGDANDTLTFRFTGAGTIGATPNLGLEVRNAANTLLATFNVGLGYAPGSDLPAVLGVNVKLVGGTANAGDSFSLNVVADADSARLLPALGINSFFAGTAAGDLRIRTDLLEHPERMALSQSGQPGDGGNLARLIALRERAVLGGQALTQALDGLLGDVGVRVQDMQARTAARTSLGQQLEAEMQSLAGVDPNEEIIHLVQYQRAFQLSARYVSAVNDMLDQLFQIL